MEEFDQNLIFALPLLFLLCAYIVSRRNREMWRAVRGRQWDGACFHANGLLRQIQRIRSQAAGAHSPRPRWAARWRALLAEAGFRVRGRAYLRTKPSSHFPPHDPALP